MKRNRIPGIIDWDEVAVAWGNLLLPSMTRIVDWLNRILRAIIKALGDEKSGNF